MIVAEQNKLDFESAIYCHICNVKYKPNVKEEIVRDHDHYTGEYKGSAHKTCNTKFYYEKSLNVFFHILPSKKSQLSVGLL